MVSHQASPSMTQAILLLFRSKMATDFELPYMEIGLLLNVSFENYNGKHPRLQIVLIMSS